MTTQHGGRRPGAGRPPHPPEQHRNLYAVRLTDDEAAQIKRLGQGNLAEGIRTMIAMTRLTGVFDFRTPELLAALDAAGDNPEAIAVAMAQVDEAIWANIRVVIPDKTIDYLKIQFRLAHNAVVAMASTRLFAAGHPSKHWGQQLIHPMKHIKAPNTKT